MERNYESELNQILSPLASRNNGIKADVVVVAITKCEELKPPSTSPMKICCCINKMVLSLFQLVLFCVKFNLF